MRYESTCTCSFNVHTSRSTFCSPPLLSSSFTSHRLLQRGSLRSSLCITSLHSFLLCFLSFAWCFHSHISSIIPSHHVLIQYPDQWGVESRSRMECGGLETTRQFYGTLRGSMGYRSPQGVDETYPRCHPSLSQTRIHRFTLIPFHLQDITSSSSPNIQTNLYMLIFSFSSHPFLFYYLLSLLQKLYTSLWE